MIALFGDCVGRAVEAGFAGEGKFVGGGWGFGGWILWFCRDRCGWGRGVGRGGRGRNGRGIIAGGEGIGGVVVW